ncbi:MAG: Bifunctional purine biosynthesis protein PurH [Dehalococcoidia bacterium]|nr:Bifunctional purine biosynthesis protein PurH [Bacillota bacterium]
MQEFTEPAAVAVKHANPCGVAVGNSIYAAYELAYEADSVSIFGGIVAINGKLDARTAEKMNEVFLEVIIDRYSFFQALSVGGSLCAY